MFLTLQLARYQVAFVLRGKRGSARTASPISIFPSLRFFSVFFTSLNPTLPLPEFFFLIEILVFVTDIKDRYLVSKTGIYSVYKNLASRLFGTSSLFSAHHTFIDMRKNMRERYEKKRGAHQGKRKG